MKDEKVFTLGELAELLEVKVIGDAGCLIHGLSTLQSAGQGQLSFLSNPAYVSQLSTCKASAVIISPSFIDQFPGSKLVSHSPYVTFAKATQLFKQESPSTQSIHRLSDIHESASIADDVSIGPFTVVGANVVIGSGGVIGPGCFIGDGTQIGENCRLHANVTIYHEIIIGDRVVICSGSIIGADGFGYAFDGEKSVKIAQLGSVRIAQDVEIGAGSTIDRGALDDTIIEQGVKIDNQVQIGHNCKIGAHTVICGCSAVAGSATIGKYCVLGGGSGVVGHISIADGVQISAMSLVRQTIKEAGSYSSGTGLMPISKWKKSIVRFQQLDELSKRVKSLELKPNNNEE